MTWIKLDDRAPRHPKLASLTDRAFRWWVLALCYASEFLTDGILPPVFWKQTPKQIRAELTGNKLWDWVDPNFEIHDYHHHQSLKTDVEADKERNRIKAKAFRDRRKAERKQADVTGDAPGNVTGNAPSDSNRLVTRPENTEHITHTPNREQTTAAPSVAPPPRLISGEANPRTWGKIHGEHVTGFCDWVCLPEFLFAEFCRKSGKATANTLADQDYVKGWAVSVRSKWSGPVGDNLKFWRDRWAESHVTAKVIEPPKHRGVAEILAEREAAKGKAS